MVWQYGMLSTIGYSPLCLQADWELWVAVAALLLLISREHCATCYYPEKRSKLEVQFLHNVNHVSTTAKFKVSQSIIN